MIAALPLATAVTLIVFRARPTLLLLSGIVLGFIGVIFLLHPADGRALIVPSLLGLAGGLCGSLAYFSTRELGQLGEPPWRVLLYFTAVSTLASGAWMLWQGVSWPRLESLPLLLGMGASATLAQLAMTRAYKEGHVLIVGSLSYSTVAFTSLLGIVFWGELLAPGEWLGLGLIIASGIMATFGLPRTTKPIELPAVPRDSHA